MSTINYRELVSKARKASRDVLRAEKVSALLGYIHNTQKSIKSLQEDKASSVKQHERYLYELRLREQFHHPDFEEYTKFVTEEKDHLDKFIEKTDTEIMALETKVLEYENKIDKWQNGESLVDKDRMYAMALEMIQTKVGNAFNQDAFDTVANEPS